METQSAEAQAKETSPLGSTTPPGHADAAGQRHRDAAGQPEHADSGADSDGWRGRHAAGRWRLVPQGDAGAALRQGIGAARKGYRHARDEIGRAIDELSQGLGR